MIDKKLYAAMATIVFIVGTAFTVDARYELHSSAAAQFDLLAGEQETGRLNNERGLIELELKMLQSKPVRSSDDDNRIEYLKQRRELIEARLLVAAKKTA